MPACSEPGPCLVPLQSGHQVRRLRWPNEGASSVGRAGRGLCSPAARRRAATRSRRRPRATPSEPTSSASPDVGRLRPARSTADYSMPLALVVHATRPTADVALADARRVVASGATRWSDIGQSGGKMRVLSTKERRAGDVLREVRASRDVLGIVPADAVDARVRVLTVGGRHPLRDPERYPLRTRSARPVPEVTTLAAVGDIMLGRRVGDRHRDDPGAPLKPLAKRLAAAEITVGNFESTLSADGFTDPGR